LRVGCAFFGMRHLFSEVRVDQIGERSSIDDEECWLAAVDDGGHDHQMITAVDAGPVLHGWRFEAVEAAEVVGGIAAERIELSGWRGWRLGKGFKPDLMPYVVECDEIAREDVGAD